MALATMRRASVRVFLEPLGQFLVGGPLDQRTDRRVAELGLGLALELRIDELDRDYGAHPFPDVLAEQVLVLFLEKAHVCGRTC